MKRAAPVETHVQVRQRAVAVNTLRQGMAAGDAACLGRVRTGVGFPVLASCCYVR